MTAVGKLRLHPAVQTSMAELLEKSYKFKFIGATTVGTGADCDIIV